MAPVKFKVWDVTTALSGKNGNTNLSFLSFRPTDGTIQFSSCAVQVMGLKDDSKVVFLESEDGASLFVCVHPTGLPLRTNNKRNKWRMSAGLFVRHIAKQAGQTRCFRVRLSRVPELLPQSQGLPRSAFRLYVNELRKS